MTNYEKIASRIIRELQLQEQYKYAIDASVRKVTELRKSLIASYPSFVEECINDNSSKFVNIERFPTTEEIRSFYQYGDVNRVSLYEYGWFDIKELVVLIKLLYSLKKQKEHKIVTVTNFQIEYKGPEDYDIEIVPYMNFLIGLDQKMKYLEEYNGKYLRTPFIDGANYFEKEILAPFNKERHQSFIRLKQRAQNGDNSLGISFVNGDEISSTLTYFDGVNWINKEAVFSSKYNIFDRCINEIIRRLDQEPRMKMGALLSFSVDIQDNFIAKALYSIVIYKKKLKKLVLDNDDYRCIFYEIFREDIDMLEVVDKEIPKVLTKHKHK